MQKSIPKWVQERMREPSTYAAIGIGAVGIGILADSSLVVLLVIIVGVGAFVLKEKGLL